MRPAARGRAATFWLLLAWLASGQALAWIGQPTQLLRDELVALQLPLAGAGDTVRTPGGFELAFEEQGGLLRRVHGVGRLSGDAEDPEVAALADALGAATVYGRRLAGPLRATLGPRLADAAGRGPQRIHLVEYLFTLHVRGSGPYQVSFTLELMEFDESLFEAARHSVGPADARFVIREFSDFQCEFCLEFHQLVMGPLLAAIERGEGIWSEVRFEFHHFPIPTDHGNARRAAEAAECVAAANTPDDFWKVHDALFERQGDWAPLGDPRPWFAALPRSLGLSNVGVAECLDLGSFAAEIDGAVLRAAERLRIVGTPTFFINGYKLHDYLRPGAYFELFDAIEAFSSP